MGGGRSERERELKESMPTTARQPCNVLAALSSLVGVCSLTFHASQRRSESVYCHGVSTPRQLRCESRATLPGCEGGREGGRVCVGVCECHGREGERERERGILRGGSERGRDLPFVMEMQLTACDSVATKHSAQMPLRCQFLEMMTPHSAVPPTLFILRNPVVPSNSPVRFRMMSR